MGKQAPGGQNVVDGLLRYQALRKNTELVGFLNGAAGLFEGSFIQIKREDYANFNNLGGYDYLGRGGDSLRTDEELHSAAETCRKLKLSGLVIVGATHTMTDAVYFSEYLLKQKIDTRIVAVPASVDGNIHHKYVQTAIGFDTCSKYYSQLIGNMLTDSASAIKYWYFIRLMGNQPSHMALECALKTNPNAVIISEECVDRKETLRDIVNNLCEIIVDRARDKKNFGAILIPEGLLSQIASFDQMIIELNQVFREAKTVKEQAQMAKNLYNEDEIKKVLSPWSYSIFISLPEFFRHQILGEREIAGEIKLSQLETERLLAYLVG